MIHCYTSWHPKSRRICEAFAKGSGGKVVGPAPILRGDVMMYGALRALMPTLVAAQEQGRTWYYADNCYLGPRNASYRVTRNATQHDGTGAAGPERWERLGLTIKPWRQSGEHILICPPTPDYGQLWGLDCRAWLATVLEAITTSTTRTWRLRERSLMNSTEYPLVADLENCWAVVTCSSNVAVDALLAGIPVFCTWPCAAYRMGWPDPRRIKEPPMPSDREQWAWNLAANQWTLAEMSDGTCWRDLNDGRYGKILAA